MILFLKPYFSQKPWAGNELNKIYDCPEQTGEAWIVSGYLNKSSIITNGKYKGQTLRHLWQKHPELFGDYLDKEFPLLIKLISSSSDLSVQVHPNDDYARIKYNQFGKFECWYILPETKAKDIIVGINAKNAIEVEQMLKQQTIENYLINKKIKPNDLIVVEPGTVHAIKANTFLLEIQESSDLTYRLYDYNRLPKRELHIEDSLNVINYSNLKNNIFDFTKEDTFKNDHFNLYKLVINGQKKYENKGFEIFYVLNGSGVIDSTSIKKGDSFIFTNDKETFSIYGNLELIAVIPKPKRKERLNLRKIAFITGIVSQDGSYLIELLLNKDYEVHGLVQSKSQIYNNSLSKYTTNDNLYNKQLFLHIGDLTDTSNLSQLIESIKPDEIYHLAGQNHVDLSFDIPEYTADVNALGTLRLLDAIKRSEYRTKLFNLSTCHLFDGKIHPQNEETKFNPVSPYAVSKLYAHQIVKAYRENYKLYAVNGICYNHESPLRDTSFLSKKVCEYIKQLKNGYIKPLKLGNIYAKREWGHAKDYAYAMWLMLQQDKPQDFIIATGKAYTVKEFVECAFKKVGITFSWQGDGINEQAIGNDGEIYIEIDSQLLRPNDAEVLVGDSTKFREQTGWIPTYDLNKLLAEMLGD